MSVLRAAAIFLSTVGLVVALVLLALFGDSIGGPQNTFAPAGEVAEKQKDLFLIALWPAIAILILVSGALAFAMFYYRRKSEDEPPPRQVHGNQRLEIAWTIAPTLLLLALAVPMIATIIDIGEAADDDALRVTVVGQRFSWTFEYPDITEADGTPLGTTNELHIPVDREIDASIESLDVLHSFWVQKLAGKQDAVPGTTNRLVFNAEEPGEYPGQCAEFCGLFHADMTFTIIAHTPEEFQAWCEEEAGGTAESCRQAASGPDVTASRE